MAKIRRIFVLFAILVIAAAVFAKQFFGSTAGGANVQSLRIECDEADFAYELDQPITFRITAVNRGRIAAEGELQVVVDNDGPQILHREKYAFSGNPVEVTVRATAPGFLRCRALYQAVDLSGMQDVLYVAVAPEKVTATVPAPDDFDAFWEQKRSELAAVPMDIELTPWFSELPGIECFDAQISAVGEAPASGILAYPTSATEGSLPAIIWAPGAGVRPASSEDAKIGAELPALSFAFNPHGLRNDQPASYFAEYEIDALHEYWHQGRNDREKSYFVGMFQRLLRSIDFVCSRPEWDRKTLVICGNSQGGALAIVGGALDLRVTLVIAGVPAMCDHGAWLAGRSPSWPDFVPRNLDNSVDQQILDVSRYFDVCNFASRCRTESLVLVGYQDDVCPPATIFAAFNQLAGKKSLWAEPSMSHGVPPELRSKLLDVIRAHMRRP